MQCHSHMELLSGSYLSGEQHQLRFYTKKPYLIKKSCLLEAIYIHISYANH